MPAKLDGLLRRVYLAVADLSWIAVLFAALAHLLLCHVLLAMAGETALTGSLPDYLYYYVTTATTVGYGDLSPQTPGGRLAGLLVVLPGSIAIFTALLGKAVADLGALWRRRMEGHGDYRNRMGHTVVLGWQGTRTRRMIELLLVDRDDDERLVLVAKSLERNPLPDAIDYVRTDALSTQAALERAGVPSATSVIIRGLDDDETLAATLATVALASDVHIVAHFEDERAGSLISQQFPHVEAIGSLSAELLVRAARDPGASRIADHLFSAKLGDTAYSMLVPEDTKPFTYFAALTGLKRLHGMTLVGVCDGSGGNFDLNCEDDRKIGPGERLYYISEARVDAGAIEWSELAGA